MFTFFVVDDLALVVFCHVSRIDAGVTDIATDVSVVLALVGDGLQKRGAAGSGAAEDQTHLTGLDQTGLTVRTGSARNYGSNARTTHGWRIVESVS